MNDAGDVEEVVDEVDFEGEVAVDDRELLAKIVSEAGITKERGDDGDGGRERGAEFVGEFGEEDIFGGVGKFEVVFGGAEGGLGLLEARDVEVDAGPSGDLAVVIANGNAAGEDGVVLTIGAEVAMFAVPGAAGADAFFPGFEGIVGIIGMEDGGPAEVDALFTGDANEFEEGIARVGIAASGIADPDAVIDGLADGAVDALGGAEGLGGLDDLMDVGRGDVPAGGAIVMLDAAARGDMPLVGAIGHLEAVFELEGGARGEGVLPVRGRSGDIVGVHDFAVVVGAIGLGVHAAVVPDLGVVVDRCASVVGDADKLGEGIGEGAELAFVSLSGAFGENTFGDFLHDHAKTDDVVAIAEGVPAFRPVACHVGIGKGGPFEHFVEDGLAGGEDVVGEATDGLKERGDNFADGATEVLLDGEAIDIGEGFVDVGVTEFEIKAGEANGGMVDEELREGVGREGGRR